MESSNLVVTQMALLKLNGEQIQFEVVDSEKETGKDKKRLIGIGVRCRGKEYSAYIISVSEIVKEQFINKKIGHISPSHA